MIVHLLSCWNMFQISLLMFIVYFRHGIGISFLIDCYIKTLVYVYVGLLFSSVIEIEIK